MIFKILDKWCSMGTSDTSYRPHARPALALYHGGFRVVLGEGPGEPGSIMAVAHQGMWKYFNTVPTAEAEVQSSGLAYRHSFIKVLYFYVVCS